MVVLFLVTIWVLVSYPGHFQRSHQRLHLHFPGVTWLSWRYVIIRLSSMSSNFYQNMGGAAERKILFWAPFSFLFFLGSGHGVKAIGWLGLRGALAIRLGWSVVRTPGGTWLCDQKSWVSNSIIGRFMYLGVGAASNCFLFFYGVLRHVCDVVYVCMCMYVYVFCDFSLLVGMSTPFCYCFNWCECPRLLLFFFLVRFPWWEYLLL